MRSPTKLLIAAVITAGTVGAGPAVAGACGWGHGGPPPHRHRPPCHGTTTTSESTTSTSESTTTTING